MYVCATARSQKAVIFLKKGKEVDIFDLTIEDFEKELDKILNSQTPEQTLAELVECGLELNNKNENKIKGDV